MSEIGWTFEREQQLVKLWNEGASASEVAREMGGFEHTKDAGRNAIMGKVNRMGIQRYAQKTPDELALDAEERRIRSAALALARYQRELASRRKVQELLDVEKVEEERKSSSLPFNDLRMFSQRTSNQCRFPLNDTAPFIVCGAVTPPGESWCPHCRDVVMAKPGPALSDEERFRRAMAFKKNALPRSVTNISRDQAA